MNDPWRALIDEVHAEVDAHRTKRGFSPYEWARHEPVRAAYVDRIVEKINTEVEEVQMAFGDRKPLDYTPLGQKPDGCDNIPGFGFLKIGQCRTEDCDITRHGMDKASGYCRPCKIKKGLLKPDAPKPSVAPVAAKWTPPEPAKVKEPVLQPSVPPELVDEVFAMLHRYEAQRLLQALTDSWAGVPLPTKVVIVRAAMREKDSAS